MRDAFMRTVAARSAFCWGSKMLRQKHSKDVSRGHSAPQRRRAGRKPAADGNGLLRSTLELQTEQLETLRQRIKLLEAKLNFEQADHREANERHPVAFVELTRAGMIQGCNAAAIRLL